MRHLRRFWKKIVGYGKKPVSLIDEALWLDTTQHYAFMRGLSREENRRLRLIASDFLSRKSIIGAEEFIVTEKMKVAIAAQASILVLELDVDNDGWSDVIVYPGHFMPMREIRDEHGVVHTSRNVLAGEAWLKGPVILSFADVARTGSDGAINGFNVVIHEFAHKLDMLNGNANGQPPLHRNMSLKSWKDALLPAYLHFCEAVDRAKTIRSQDGGAAFNALPINSYASENPAEFFAVLSEAFFELPENVAAVYPLVYAQLKLFYRQDPLGRQRLVR